MHSGKYNREGIVKVLAGAEKRVRWEEGEFEMLDPNGERIRVDVVIAAAQDIELGSIMWKGQLVNFAVPALLFEVVTRSTADDLDGTRTRYEFGLKRYTNQLPEIISG